MASPQGDALYGFQSSPIRDNLHGKPEEKKNLTK